MFQRRKSLGSKEQNKNSTWISPTKEDALSRRSRFAYYFSCAELFCERLDKNDKASQFALVVDMWPMDALISDELDEDKIFKQSINYLRSAVKDEKAVQAVEDITTLKPDSNEIYFCGNGNILFAEEKDSKTLFVVKEPKKDNEYVATLPKDFAPVVKIQKASLDLEKLKLLQQQAMKNLQDNLLKHSKIFLHRLDYLEYIHDKCENLREWVRQYVEKNLRDLFVDITQTEMLVKMISRDKTADFILQKPDLFLTDGYALDFFIRDIPGRRKDLPAYIERNQDIFFKDLFAMQRVIEAFPDSDRLDMLAADYVASHPEKFASSETYGENIAGNESRFFDNWSSIRQMLVPYPRCAKIRELAIEHVLTNKETFLSIPQDVAMALRMFPEPDYAARIREALAPTRSRSLSI